MIWLVRAVTKTYETGACGSASVKLIEVEADDEEEAKVAVINLIGQQEKRDHRVICTAVFEKGCELHDFSANVTYMATDEFDDYATEGLTMSFYIQAPSLDEAKKIAQDEVMLHLHQYAYFREMSVCR